jgi:hypothetical protein
VCGRFDPGERYTGVNWTEAERHVQSAPEDASTRLVVISQDTETHYSLFEHDGVHTDIIDK